MKIEYDDNDKDYMEKVNESINGNGKYVPIIINSNSFYYIKFKANDYAKANNFILSLLGNSDVSNHMKDMFGIEIDSVYLSNPDSKKNEIAEYLRKVANELEGM